MPPPLIGITVSLIGEAAGGEAGRAETLYDHVKRSYSLAVRRAGGLPLLLPNLDDPEALDDLAGRLDGLLLAGGADLDPRWYGQRNTHSRSVRPARDRTEIRLVRRAAEIGLPVLGICRGIQTVNAAFGGSLFQDTSLLPRAVRHKNPKGGYVHHAVRIEAGSRLGRLVNKPSLTVNSSHHQHLDRLAPGFRVGARALDGSVEAVERFDPGVSILAVQWHPEEMPAQDAARALFRDLVERSLKFGARRSRMKG